jgi:diguanylate cyclase (GGDEF)-like protein
MNFSNHPKIYNLLIVDDDVIVLETLVALVRSQVPVVSIHTASTVEEAKKKFQELRGNVDILILDYIKLPFLPKSLEKNDVYPGDAVVKNIRQSNPYTYIIAMTGYGDTRDIRTHIYSLGVNDFLEKPIRDKELFAALFRAMGNLNAFYDPLTGLMNRRLLDDTLYREVSRSKRGGQPISIIMADVDNFKQYNDTYGHQQGDKVLLQLGEVFLRSRRGQDAVIRYGGEEFLWILPETNLKGGIRLARRLQSSVNEMKVPWFEEATKPPMKLKTSYSAIKEEGKAIALNHEMIRLTMGIATFPKHTERIEELIFCADDSLYKGKESGKNTIYIYDQGVIANADS